MATQRLVAVSRRASSKGFRFLFAIIAIYALLIVYLHRSGHFTFSTALHDMENTVAGWSHRGSDADGGAGDRDAATKLSTSIFRFTPDTYYNASAEKAWSHSNGLGSSSIGVIVHQTHRDQVLQMQRFRHYALHANVTVVCHPAFQEASLPLPNDETVISHITGRTHSIRYARASSASYAAIVEVALRLLPDADRLVFVSAAVEPFNFGEFIYSLVAKPAVTGCTLLERSAHDDSLVVASQGYEAVMDVADRIHFTARLAGYRPGDERVRSSTSAVDALSPECFAMHRSVFDGDMRFSTSTEAVARLYHVRHELEAVRVFQEFKELRDLIVASSDVVQLVHPVVHDVGGQLGEINLRLSNIAHDAKDVIDEFHTWQSTVRSLGLVDEQAMPRLHQLLHQSLAMDEPTTVLSAERRQLHDIVLDYSTHMITSRHGGGKKTSKSTHPAVDAALQLVRDATAQLLASVIGTRTAFYAFTADIVLGTPFSIAFWMHSMDLQEKGIGLEQSEVQAYLSEHDESHHPIRTARLDRHTETHAHLDKLRLSAAMRQPLLDISVTWTSWCCGCCGFSAEIMHFLVPLQRRVRTRTVLGSSCFCQGAPSSTMERIDLMHLDRDNIPKVAPNTTTDVWVMHIDPLSYEAQWWAEEPPDYLVGRSMYEFSVLPGGWVTAVKEHADELWVPSVFVRDMFHESGVPLSSIHIIPEAIDLHLYNPNVVSPFPLPPIGNDFLVHDSYPSVSTRTHFKFLSVFKWEDR
eukprot:PhM_4_TR14077/c1_g1_i1/m.60787